MGEDLLLNDGKDVGVAAGGAKEGDVGGEEEVGEEDSASAAVVGEGGRVGFVGGEVEAAGMRKSVEQQRRENKGTHGSAGSGSRSRKCASRTLTPSSRAAAVLLKCTTGSFDL
jgi:hypothetical protein